MSPPADRKDALAERLHRLGIREEDLDESFVRSSGAGGQNVNKVSTCVVLLHRPTGISVKCQEERSQALNRYRARQLLADRIEAERLQLKRAEAARMAKVRRQKRRRSPAAKERMLEQKRARAKTKTARGPVREEE